MIRSERGSIGDSFTIMITIGLAAIVMIVVPLLSTANRIEDMDQVKLEAALKNFAEDCASKGKITLADYEAKVVNQIDNVNKYDVKMEVWKIDQNPNKKNVQTRSKLIGENTYIIEYTTDIMQVLYDKGEYPLEEGWKIYIYANNTNRTLEQSFSGQANADISTHSAEAVVTVRKNAD